MTDLFGLSVAFLIQLFILVDPVAGVPVFLSITAGNSPEQRRQMARRGCVVAFGTVVFFLLTGSVLTAYFGITPPAVRICGGILLFFIGLDMLHGRTRGTESSARERRLAEEKEDVSITPLAIPLLAGPGAIATVLIFAEKADALIEYASLLALTALVFAITNLFLQKAERIMRLIGPLGATVLSRVMGLVLTFLAVQYVLDGLTAVW
ncbi:MAG TPA: NAAT family transporter [Geoalkalibacter subterraneus]|uniref:UPF0056 membrane protein n=1 Tax=Geoalkalibacter subterraneus TaxID=483547 RepID=A0A831PJE3_9BACT|nr:NAAT family transporter [Geoalkalibacter subterraneus]